LIIGNAVNAKRKHTHYLKKHHRIYRVLKHALLVRASKKINLNKPYSMIDFMNPPKLSPPLPITTFQKDYSIITSRIALLILPQ